MSADGIREVGTFFIGIIVLAGCGYLIATSRGSEEQAWLMIGVVVAYFFNRQQQSSAARDARDSQPTIHTTSGPPSSTTVTSADNHTSDTHGTAYR
jgi:hypothetical protein